MSLRIPPLLEPYLALPSEASLILLTSVLGASSNWLVLRFLHSSLTGSDGSSGAVEDESKVVLVSFMRDLAFWKEGGRRLGLDFDKLALKKRFAFVDGLSGLFLPRQNVAASKGIEQRGLSSPKLENVSQEIQTAIQVLRDSPGSGKVLLVIDQLDLLIAAGSEQIGACNVGEMLMDLREDVHATILSISADQPLVSGHHTPLELDHAAFLLNTAHQADFIMGLRLLDTGTARDVSGVLRVTVGDKTEEDKEDIQKRMEERELLFFVGGDGGVKVFERGQ
ncbi:uncharacterized protein L3040_006124 [Drepanopeziza brunnea f. sp. 'multigermtubi']|uniref:uncharacterized protein n=1 Tax=Drepanopeziza brunnea f. sp. 'multigermtubi' TaxID=698441 RepID=UPI00239E6885|nr:hypothetical protein L3040_006124 [Drepanopeziza brunnea f. sp. 'multigermtubi']